jgi:hypothetical protein
MARKTATALRASSAKQTENSIRFEATKLEGLYPVLDAVAWMDSPTTAQISQFAGLDPRTVGKILKNTVQIGLIGSTSSGYVLLASYPYKGSLAQKSEVVREALVKMKFLESVRQFLALGEPLDAAARKAATVNEFVPYRPEDFAPLLEWARSLGALEAGLVQEDLVRSAEAAKEVRHQEEKDSRIAFLSHSSLDKSFVRQLAADLTGAGITVWLDEQRIRVGESIPEKISQGLAESDFFLLVTSKNSLNSEWVKKELNSALVSEVQRRAVHVLPVRIDDSPLPGAINDKKYADFSKSYKDGLNDLIAAIKGGPND